MNKLNNNLNNDEVKINEIINLITGKIKTVKEKYKKEKSFLERCRIKRIKYEEIYEDLNYKLEYFLKNKIEEAMFDNDDEYFNEIEKIILSDNELKELNKNEEFNNIIENILYIRNINVLNHNVNLINPNIIKNKNYLKIIDIVNEYLNNFEYLDTIIKIIENNENEEDYVNFVINHNIYFNDKIPQLKNFIDRILKADKDFILVFKKI